MTPEESIESLRSLGDAQCEQIKLASHFSTFICNRLKPEWPFDEMQTKEAWALLIVHLRRHPFKIRASLFQKIGWYLPNLDQQLYSDFAWHAVPPLSDASEIVHKLIAMRKRIFELETTLADTRLRTGRKPKEPREPVTIEKFHIGFDVWNGIMKLVVKTTNDDDI